MRLGRLVVGVAWSAVAFARPAEASEAHFAGDEVRLTVDEAGSARVEHALSYRVVGGPPKGFDLTGIEPEAVLDPVAPVAFDGETMGSAQVERRGERAVRITLDGDAAREGAVRSGRTHHLAHAHAHGVLVVRVSYGVDLVQARELTLDGAMWRLSWIAPEAPEGYDGARVVFDVPAAPTEPRVLAEDGTVGDEGREVTLRRGTDRDELEMARPHVARGEAAGWMVRVDPRAFPRVVDPSLRPEPIAAGLPAREGGLSAWIVALVAGAAFGALVRVKWGRIAQACAGCGLEPKGLLGKVSLLGRASVAGAGFAVAIGLEASGRPAWGACGIALAMLAGTARRPGATASPRGPGQWLPLSPSEAFAPERGMDLLDVATWGGKGALLVIALAAAAIGLALRPVDSLWLWLAPLDALALFPLFVTGSRAQLPPHRARAPRRRLSSLHRLLKRDPALRVAPWARVPLGASAPDELRLLVLPRAAMPGVVGIEVGVAWIATPAGYAAQTEVLVRVREATAAAARMTALGPNRRSVHGRKTDERVVRLVPALPSRAGVAALVRRLAAELRDRRKSLPSIKWPGTERRLPPNERAKGGAPGRPGTPGRVPSAA